jgi:predicted dehydrogenase
VHVWDVENQSPGIGSPPDEPAPPDLNYDFWLGPSPALPYNRNRYQHAYWFFDYGGGWQVAWGAHHFDIVHWAMGVNAPVTATGTGGKFAFPGDNREWPDTFQGSCEYPAGPVADEGFLLTYTCRLGATEAVAGRRHGKTFYGTDALLTIDRSGFETVSQERGGKKLVVEKQVTSSKKEHEVVQDHVRGFLERLRSRRMPAAHVEVGHLATNPGHLMNIAWRLGRRIRWDAQNERTIDDPQAQDLLHKRYRAPWELPS